MGKLASPRSMIQGRSYRIVVRGHEVADVVRFDGTVERGGGTLYDFTSVNSGFMFSLEDKDIVSIDTWIGAKNG